MKSERAAVLDASAILAMLQKETGAEKLTDDVLDRSAVSTVNLAEVQGKLVLKGVAPGEAWMHATAAVESIEAYTGEHAKLAGALIAQTRSLSLSRRPLMPGSRDLAQGRGLHHRACLEETQAGNSDPRDPLSRAHCFQI
jgi:PIN domain nuclease of toxin-antitoxin system